MYTNVNNKAYITGMNGKYTNEKINYYVRYGKNTIDNYREYKKEVSKPKFELDYKHVKLPNTNDPEFLEKLKKALGEFNDSIETAEKQASTLINNNDEIGNFKTRTTIAPEFYQVTYMPQFVDVREARIALMGAAYEAMSQKTQERIDIIADDMDIDRDQIEKLDINHDGHIDVGEYSAAIIMADFLSKDEEKQYIEYVDGTVTKDGQERLLDRITSKSKEYMNIAFSKIYEYFSLRSAKERFIKILNSSEDK